MNKKNISERPRATTIIYEEQNHLSRKLNKIKREEKRKAERRETLATLRVATA